MNKPNILLLGMSGNVTQGILAAIKQNNQEANIYGACIFSNSIGKYLVDEFFVSPYANRSEFITWLIDICNTKSIDLVLTGVEENILAISQNLEKLQSQTNSKFIVATPEQLNIGNDKLLTCKWLKDNGCNYPAYADLDNDIEVNRLLTNYKFPFIAKPRNGKGSHGIFKIEKKQDLSQIKDKSNYVLQECLGDDNNEYTVAVYSNKNGIFQNMVIMRRELQNGTTIMAETVENSVIYDECKKIANALKISGPLNIQLRMHNGKPVCFELNIRFSGTTPLRNLLGFRDLYAAIREYLYNENPLQFLKYKSGKVIRLVTERLV